MSYAFPQTISANVPVASTGSQTFYPRNKAHLGTMTAGTSLTPGALGDSSQCCEDLGNSVKCISSVHKVTTTGSDIETAMTNRVVYGPSPTFGSTATNQPFITPGFGWHLDLLLNSVYQDSWDGSSPTLRSASTHYCDK